MAAKIESIEGQPADAATGSDDKLNQQLRTIVEDLQRIGIQPSPLEDEPVERDDLRPGITSYLDQEASERKAIYDRLVAIENEVKKRGSRRFGRYLVAILIGVAATLAWQSYGDSAREMIAGSSPQLSWLAPPAAPVAEAPAAPSPDQEELKEIWLSLAGVRQRVDQIAAQLAAGQEQVTRDINNLQAVEQDILDKISAPPPRPAAPARKSVPLTPLPLTPLPLTPPEAQPAR